MLLASTKMSERIIHWDALINDSSKNYARSDKRKSRVVQELEEKRMKERLAEELECQKQFKAQEVPEFVRIPMYDEVLRQQEERKLLAKQRSRDLLQMVRPFSFINRDNANSYERNSKNKHAEENEYFKASPFPSKIFEPSFEQQIKEKEIARKSVNESRRKLLLESSSAPKSIIEHDKLVEKRETMKSILLDFLPNGANTFRPKINHEVPNFDMIHQNISKQKCSDGVLNTKCIPFNFETDQRKKKHVKRDRKISFATLDSGRRILSKAMSISMDAIPIVATKTSILRAKNAKSQNEEVKRLAEMMTRKAQIKEIRKRDLQRAVRQRSAVHDPNMGRIGSAMSREYSEKSRQYTTELNEMNRRINNRPLLFEQVIERNARLLAEKRHHDILEAHNINYDDLNKLINDGDDDDIKMSNDLQDDRSQSNRSNRSKHNNSKEMAGNNDRESIVSGEGKYDIVGGNVLSRNKNKKHKTSNEGDDNNEDGRSDSRTKATLKHSGSDEDVKDKSDNTDDDNDH